MGIISILNKIWKKSSSALRGLKYSCSFCIKICSCLTVQFLSWCISTNSTFPVVISHFISCFDRWVHFEASTCYVAACIALIGCEVWIGRDILCIYSRAFKVSQVHRINLRQQFRLSRDCTQSHLGRFMYLRFLKTFILC